MTPLVRDVPKLVTAGICLALTAVQPWRERLAPAPKA